MACGCCREGATPSSLSWWGNSHFTNKKPGAFLLHAAGFLRLPNRQTERVAGGIRDRRPERPAKARTWHSTVPCSKPPKRTRQDRIQLLHCRRMGMRLTGYEKQPSALAVMRHEVSGVLEGRRVRRYAPPEIAAFPNSRPQIAGLAVSRRDRGSRPSQCRSSPGNPTPVQP
jgi:hypothetical protein